MKALALAAALVATMMASPVMASSNAVCQDIANNTGWRTGTWDDTDGRCVMSGRNVQQQQQIEQADERRSHPDANAVYYGTPPAETGTATASIGQNQICIMFPTQPSDLTGQGNIKLVDVHGGVGYHDSGVVLTENGSGFGAFIHFGDMYIDRGRQCISAKGRLANAELGTGFPVALRPRSAGRIVDATNPGMNCVQSTGSRAGATNPAFLAQQARGQCGQRHFTFRKMAHCAGAGESGNLSAGSCRIWVVVQN